MRFRRVHLFWLLATPGWQFLDFVRHEASHAAAALLTGVPVGAVYVFPPQARFPWFSGYVWYGVPGSWVIVSAPFLCDVLVCAGAMFMLLRTRIGRRAAIAINVFAVGMVAPFFVTAWRYAVTASAPDSGGDIGLLWERLPRVVVDGLFLAALVFYFVGMLVVLRSWRARSASRKATPPNSAQEPDRESRFARSSGGSAPGPLGRREEG